jgi:peptidoglycan/LPS O-acetylase OafA/YrhL
VNIKYNNLTFARFLAALLVYLHHTSFIDESWTPRIAANFMRNGHVGVSFFFVLSGYVIAASSLDKLRNFELLEIRHFGWRRIIRIIPLWLIVSFPLIATAISRSDPALTPFLTFTQVWYSELPIIFGVLPVAWTLSIEMMFYCLFPIVAFAMSKMRLLPRGAWLIVAGLAIPTAGAAFFAINPSLAALDWGDPYGPHRWLYTFPPSRFGEFLTGIGIYIAVSNQAWPIGPRGSLTLLLTSIAILLMFMTVLPNGGVWFVFPYAAIFALIIFLLARLELTGFRVKSTSLLLLGESSFALYLTHQTYMLGWVYPRLLGALHNRPIVSILVFLLSVLLSVAMFILVQNPIHQRLLHLLHRESRPTYSVQNELRAP